MSIAYKRHIVDPRVYELADGSGWTAEVYISHVLATAILDRLLHHATTINI